MVWVLPAGNEARLHRRRSDGSRNPQCAPVLEVVESGVGMASAKRVAPTTKWCKRCALDLFMLCDRG